MKYILTAFLFLACLALAGFLSRFASTVTLFIDILSAGVLIIGIMVLVLIAGDRGLIQVSPSLRRFTPFARRVGSWLTNPRQSSGVDDTADRNPET